MLMPTRTVKPRKDPTKQQLARRGLATLLVILVLLGLIRLRTSGAWGGPPMVSADLRNAGGALTSGSDVKLFGLVVGRVKSITNGTDGGVRVTLAMQDDQLPHVPANVVARILPATVFGTTYVDLRPTTGETATSGAASLKPGAVVPADTSQDTLELQQALDDIDRLVKALGPADLATAIGAVSVALQGRGEQLGTTIDGLDAYLHQFNPELTQVGSDLDQLATLLQLVDKVAPDLLDATDDGLVALKTLVDHRTDLDGVLVNATKLAKSGDTFLTTNTKQLERFLSSAFQVIDALHDNPGGISAAVQANQKAAKVVQGAMDKGILKIDAKLRLDSPRYYGTGDRPSFGGN
ncbi:MCE family protein [Nocardioides sp. Kera G14]|uniref:MCE family protein n=1 Tax=Nocardioides sp. Kera G14 TaxID=2884264 RepID=UPI001D1279FC|nr:MCE family protein [Nocardioides sp. Kera G14]UDY22324.1 MCE family protein [Nocardioides sp. Kera G14]